MLKTLSVSKRVKNITPSPTMAMNAKTKELISQGKNVINMSVGEPDFDTPRAINEAGISAIQNGRTRDSSIFRCKTFTI